MLGLIPVLFIHGLLAVFVFPPSGIHGRDTAQALGNLGKASSVYAYVSLGSSMHQAYHIWYSGVWGNTSLACLLRKNGRENTNKRKLR